MGHPDHECGIYGVPTKRSNINNPSSGMTCFVNPALTPGKTIFNYYGTIPYKNMYAYKMKVYGEGAMVASSSAFQEYVIQLKRKMRCPDLCDLTGWVGRAKSNYSPAFIDSRSLPGELSLSGASSLPERKNNFRFEKKVLAWVDRTFLGMMSLLFRHSDQLLRAWTIFRLWF